ncbi:polyprenyl synthetase family protein [Alloscardovia criceti]|uniref:polyprenyl synthetase family protein n=1 Tax=Alloscardovia criceti TaxID=356828 RepID=UPI00036825FF|nr:polyprenyl synthetase family protein [Alloscardovia criceti]
MELTKHDVDERLELLVTNAWEKNARHFPQVNAPDVLRILDSVGSQGVVSSRGGKRLRALLLATTAQTLTVDDSSQDEESILDLGCAIEIFQTAALIHDDIIDNADTRRGAPSAHKALNAVGLHHNQGTALALMLGDLLATLSIRTAHAHSSAYPQAARIFSAFLDMHDQVELGQVMDVSMQSLDLTETEALESSVLATYANKTASYTTIAPLLMGILASDNTAAHRSAEKFAQTVGQDLGVAFQIHDDLLDLLSDPQITGKPTCGDIREGKRTYILSQALRHASTSDTAFLIDTYMGETQISEKQMQRIREIFRTSGAIDASIDTVERLWAHAAQEILTMCMSLDISADKTQRFIDFCQKFVA